MMKILLHLILVCRVEMSCYALEELFGHLIPNNHVENHGLRNNLPPSIQEVDMMDAHNAQERLNWLSSMDLTNNLKRPRDSSYSSSFSCEENPLKKTEKHTQIEQSPHGPIFNNAIDLSTKLINADKHCRNQIPAHDVFARQRSPMTSDGHDFSSSAYMSTLPKVSSGNLHGSSASVSNKTPNFERDSNQDFNFSERESQQLVNDKHSITKKLKSIEGMLLSDDQILDAPLIPNLQFTRSTWENTMNPSNHLSFSPEAEASVMDKPNLQGNQNAETSFRQLALFPRTTPVSEDRIQDRCLQFSRSKLGGGKNKPHMSTTQMTTLEFGSGPIPPPMKLYLTCEETKQILFSFLYDKYNLKAGEYILVPTNPKVASFFPEYLIYVEMIDQTILSSKKPSEGGMKSACESFSSLCELLHDKERKQRDPGLWKYMNSQLKTGASDWNSGLIWCFLEFWLRTRRPTLFYKVKMKQQLFSVSESFKRYLNYHFSANLEVLTLRLRKAFPPDPPSYTSVSPESLRLSFVPKVFKFEYQQPHIELKANSLRTLVETSNTLVVKEHEIKELISKLHFQKKNSRANNRNHKLSETSNQFKSAPVSRKNSLSDRLDILKENSDTWIRYFHHKYKLGIFTYHQSLEDKLQRVFLVYLFFVEMINEIVPRKDLQKGGMESAFSSFKRLLNIRGVPQSQQNNPGFQEKLNQLIRNRGSENFFLLLGVFLEAWLKSSRTSLIAPYATKRENKAWIMQFKSFFADIFSFSCEGLTNQVKQYT